MSAIDDPENKAQTGTPWIRIEDFVETTYWVSVENVTTQTPINKGTEIELAEVSDQGLTLKLPANACALGHFLVIQFHERKRSGADVKPVPGKTPRPQFEVTAKVVGDERIGTAHKTITVQLYQYNENQWREFLAEYARRQDAVNKELNNLKS